MEINLEAFLTKGEPLLTESLKPAVLMSLFTDRRENGERGWWGHCFVGEFGSRLWTLERAKRSQNTLDKAEQYAKEALQWLIDERHAQAIFVKASFVQNVLMLKITIDSSELEVSI